LGCAGAGASRSSGMGIGGEAAGWCDDAGVSSRGERGGVAGRAGRSGLVRVSAESVAGAPGPSWKPEPGSGVWGRNLKPSGVE
jgi:hypothetical protein